MDEERVRSQLTSLVPMLLLILASIAGGTLVPALVSNRPAPYGGAERSDDKTTESAHLWTDPFRAEAIQQVVSFSQPRWHDMVQNSSTEIIHVLLSSRVNPEDIESRRRSRIAMHAALARCGFVSLHPDRLYDLCPSTVNKPPALRSFEWAFNDKVDAARLILYLDEETLCESNSIAAMASINQFVIEKLIEIQKSNINSKVEHINVLGPTSSHIAQKMFADVSRALVPPCASLVIDCFSPSATAPFDAILPKDAVVTKGQHEQSCEVAAPSCRLLMRRPGSDKQLFERIVAELRNRTTGKLADIYLIVEEDYVYGRAAADSLRQILSGPDDPSVKTIWFARGVDGYTPLRSEKTGKASNAPSQQTRESELAGKGLSQSLASGDAQTDYFERLRSTIASEAQNRVSAIGLLGFDVYDKLLIVQCLRDAFPATTFFTTDLDAEQFTRASYPVTHNMLVVSHFGLVPEPFGPDSKGWIGAPILPFRSAYQTAFYLGARSLLQSQSIQAPCEHKAKVFEIGRFGHIDLDHAADMPNFAGNRPLSWRLFVALCMAALVFGLILYRPARTRMIKFTRIALYMYCTDTKEGVPRHNPLARMANAILWSRISVVAIAILVVLPLVIALEDVWSRPGEEPFFWNQGVSVWPTIIIRLLISAAALLLVRLQARRFRKGLKQVELDYPDLAPANDQERKAKNDAVVLATSGWQSALYYGLFPFDLIRGMRRAKDPEDREPVNITDVWLTLRWSEKSWSSWMRCGVICIPLVLYVLWMLTESDMYVHPVRGIWSIRIEQLSGLTAGLMLSIALAQAIDQAAMCLSFVRHFRRAKSVWRKAVDTRFMGGLHVSKKNTKFTRLLELGEHVFDLEIVGKITALAASAVLVPFLMVGALALSRIIYFDNWNWPNSLLALFAFAMLACIVPQLLINNLCARLRRESILALTKSLHQAKVTENNADLIELLLSDVRLLQEGGFRPFMEWPVVRLGVVPLFGLGSVPVLQFLAQFYW